MCARPADARAAPADLEAERAVLGAGLLDASAIHSAADEGLEAAHFSSEAHRLIFTAMLDCAICETPIDVTTIADALGNDLERAGGRMNLSTLVDGLPRSPNVGEYARIVMQKDKLCRLARLGQDLSTAALGGEETADLLVAISAVQTGNGGPPEKLILAEVKRQRIRREAVRRINSAERGAAPPAELSTLRELLAGPRPGEPQWTIPKWQPAGSRVILAAQFKAGKTVLTGNLCRSLVDGADFLGAATVTPIPGTVALLDFEMGEAQLLAWLEEQGIRHTDRLLVVPMRGKAAGFDLLDTSVRATWAALLKEHDVRYLIIDCLRPVLDALGLDENHEAGRFLVALDALLVEAEIPDCLVVHHMGHAGERSRGDSRLRDWPDVEWRLMRQGDDDLTSSRFITAYGRDVDQPETQLSFDPETRRLTAVGGTRRQAAELEALDAVIAVLTDADEPLSGRGVESAIPESSVPRAAVRAALRDGIRQGQIAVESGPRNAKLHTLTDFSAPVRQTAPPVRQRSESECASAPIGRAHSHSRSEGSELSAPGGALDEVVEL